jgi:hypothetical protein
MSSDSFLLQVSLFKMKFCVTFFMKLVHITQKVQHITIQSTAQDQYSTVASTANSLQYRIQYAQQEEYNIVRYKAVKCFTVQYRIEQYSTEQCITE